MTHKASISFRNLFIWKCPIYQFSVSTEFCHFYWEKDCPQLLLHFVWRWVISFILGFHNLETDTVYPNENSLPSDFHCLSKLHTIIYKEGIYCTHRKKKNYTISPKWFLISEDKPISWILIFLDLEVNHSCPASCYNCWWSIKIISPWKLKP